MFTMHIVCMHGSTVTLRTLSIAKQRDNAMQIFRKSLTARKQSPELLAALALLDRNIRDTMDTDIDRSGLSRDQVADGMGVSVHQLNAWLAPNRQNSRFPCILLSLFCETTGSDALKRLLLGPELCELLELGEHAAAILDQRARRRLLKVPNSDRRNGSMSCVR